MGQSAVRALRKRAKIEAEREKLNERCMVKSVIQRKCEQTWALVRLVILGRPFSHCAWDQSNNLSVYRCISISRSSTSVKAGVASLIHGQREAELRRSNDCAYYKWHRLGSTRHLPTASNHRCSSGFSQKSLKSTLIASKVNQPTVLCSR